MERLMNEGEWDHTISATVVEGPVDCVRMDEVAAALRKMRGNGAPGLSGLVAEVMQSTGDIGALWMLDLCNGIVKEGCIPEDWRSSVVLPVCREKEGPVECGSCQRLSCLNMLWGWWKDSLKTEFGSRLIYVVWISER